MKRSREEEIMFGALQRAGCEATADIGKAVINGLRQIRRERYEERVAQKEAHSKQKRNYYNRNHRVGSKNMDLHKEFIERVNSAVNNKCQVEPGEHKGDEITVIVPVPAGFSIDCNDTTGINLDNVRISILAEKEIKDANGNILLDQEAVKSMGTLYEVRGFVK